MKKQMSKWKAANYGSDIGKRMWFVVRHEEAIFHRNRLGHVIYFGSYEAAARRAQQLNSQEELAL